VRRVLVTISYDVESAKRDAYLAHVREMKEHARDVLSLDYEVYEDLDHQGAFVEVFTCGSPEDYEALDEKQDDAFREMVARLERFTDLRNVKYRAIGQLP
jgi:hypothetical protein